MLVLSLDENGEVLGNGSGSIISEDGLILTNAHVAKPSAPGLGSEEEGDPASYQIALVGGEDDRPAAPEYVAETIVADGVLDLAVMQITTDIEGNPVDAEDLDLPEPLPIADSDELRTGDEITALGFPGVAHVATTEDFERRALTVTRGVVSTFLQELPVDENRAWIDSDIRIGSGNSGGASINTAGELVGINTAVVTEATVADSGEGGSFTGGSARIRPVNFAKDLIEIAEDGGDPDYVSPLLEEMQAPPTEMPAAVQVTAAGWTGDGQGGCTGSSSVDTPQEYAVPNAGPGDLRGVRGRRHRGRHAGELRLLRPRRRDVAVVGRAGLELRVGRGVHLRSLRGAQGRERRQRGVPGRGPGARPEPGGVRRAVGRGFRALGRPLLT